MPYDWRKGACDENAAAIDAKVEQALRTTGAKQVVLIAHSLGGLVCRDYISRGDNARKVRALIAVGTPWLGARRPAGALSRDTMFARNCDTKFLAFTIDY